MSLLIWRIICIVSAALFVAGVITLVVTNLTKNKYYHNYHEDELLKKERSSNSVNSIYLTSGETKRFIRKYVVCKTVYEKYLVCNFTEKFKKIKFFVVQFTKRKRVLSVLEVTQRDVTSDASKIIALKRGCARVNVLISSVDGLVINENYVRPISTYRLMLYAFIKSVVIFAGLMVVRHVLIELLGSDLIYGADVLVQYLNDACNYIAIGASFVLALCSYAITVLCFRHKSAKVRNGGALEYEFV